MALIGYARVSSVGQSLDVQLDKLQHCDKIYQEKKSGTVERHSQLEACLEYVREGDTLIVSRLDRLARSTLHLCQIADLLNVFEIDRPEVSVTQSVAEAIDKALAVAEPDDLICITGSLYVVAEAREHVLKIESAKRSAASFY
jgi:DNA invertase Pin-like site-specific DNA recombinase